MKFMRLSLLLGCFVVGNLAATAQINIFMKVMDPGQINGEATFSTFANWTEIEAFNAGSTAESSWSGGGGAGIASPKCFTISMRQDKMAYYLKKKCLHSLP